jgi:hypothetical protein
MLREKYIVFNGSMVDVLFLPSLLGTRRIPNID